MGTKPLSKTNREQGQAAVLETLKGGYLRWLGLRKRNTKKSKKFNKSKNSNKTRKSKHSK